MIKTIFGWTLVSLYLSGTLNPQNRHTSPHLSGIGVVDELKPRELFYIPQEVIFPLYLRRSLGRDSNTYQWGPVECHGYT